MASTTGHQRTKRKATQTTTAASTTASLSPGALLHHAISKNDLDKCRQILSCPTTGPAAAIHKNFRGSTPLMLAADGACGKRNSLVLINLLLEAGAEKSAAHKSCNGRTAADIAECRGKTKLAERLRCLEEQAEEEEDFRRCMHCKGRLRKRSKLAFLADKIRRGEERNPLLLCLFCVDDKDQNESCHNQNNAVVEGLDRTEFHRVNSCINFRKELTESMALIEELRLLRRNTTMFAGSNNPGSISTSANGELTGSDTAFKNWKDWHVIDLCSGSSLTGALILHMMPGCFVTAVDIVGRENLPHFAEAGFGCGDGIGEDSSQFSYVQGDVNDPGLVRQLRNRIQVCRTTTATARPIVDTSNDKVSATTTGATLQCSSRSIVVVLAMHCCGALSLRAVDIYHELDADAAFLMPCCLPPKSPTIVAHQERVRSIATTTAATLTNTEEVDAAFSSSLIATNEIGSGITVDISWRGIEEEIAQIFTSRNQDEQHRRWTILLRKYAEVQDAGMIGVHNKATMRDIPAVLSARRTLISISRRRKEKVDVLLPMKRGIN